MNSKKWILLLVISISAFSCTNKTDNKEASDSSQWVSLFNGKNLEGWVVKINKYELGDNYKNTFRVTDGVIQVNYDGYDAFDQRFGHIFYTQPFSSYHLKFEYRFTDQWLNDAPDYTILNSGVMFHSQDPKTILKDQDWPISIEYQLLAGEENGEPHPTGNMCSPGTNVMYNNTLDPRHCINSTSPTYKWDEWVRGELIVYEDSIAIHIVNGDTVLQYTNMQIGDDVVNGFDPAIKIDGKPLKEGFIALQSEGQGVEFREIQIKDLK